MADQFPNLTPEGLSALLMGLTGWTLLERFKIWRNRNRLDMDYDTMTLKRAQEIETWRTHYEQQIDELKAALEEREDKCLRKIQFLEDALAEQKSAFDQLLASREADHADALSALESRMKSIEDSQPIKPIRDEKS